MAKKGLQETHSTDTSHFWNWFTITSIEIEEKYLINWKDLKIQLVLEKKFMIDFFLNSDFLKFSTHHKVKVRKAVLANIPPPEPNNNQETRNLP